MLRPLRVSVAGAPPILVENAPLAALATRFGHGAFTTGVVCARAGLRHVRDHVARLTRDASLHADDRVAAALAALRCMAKGHAGATGRIVVTAKSYWVSVEAARRSTFHNVPAPFWCKVVNDPRPMGLWPKHTERAALDVGTAAAVQGGWGGALMVREGGLTEGTTFHIALLDGAGLVVPEHRSGGTAEAFAARQCALRSAVLDLSDLVARGGIAMNALMGFAPVRGVVHNGRKHRVTHYNDAFWRARQLSRAFFKR